MATFRDYQIKLNGLQSMRRVTQTMKMVAATRLHQAQAALQRTRPYGAALADALSSIRVRGSSDLAGLLDPRRTVRNGLLLVCTSDRGLCGSANAAVIRAVRDWLDHNQSRFSILRASFSGRRGWQALRQRIEVRSHYEGAAARPSADIARRIGQDLCSTFLSGRYDEVLLFYNRFVTPVYQEVTAFRLLPMDPAQLPPARTGPGSQAEIACEPSAAALGEQLLLQFVRFRVYDALLNSAASEQGARMAAMENATTNIDRLIETTRLERNRRRQGAITRELSEIVSGAEAFAGLEAV